MSIGTKIQHHGSEWTIANLFEMNGAHFMRLWNGRSRVNVTGPMTARITPSRSRRRAPINRASGGGGPHLPPRSFDVDGIQRAT